MCSRWDATVCRPKNLIFFKLLFMSQNDFTHIVLLFVLYNRLTVSGNLKMYLH